MGIDQGVEHLEIQGKKVEITGKTADALKKVETSGVGETLSQQDADALRRAAEAKRKIAKLLRSGS